MVDRVLYAELGGHLRALSCFEERENSLALIIVEELLTIDGEVLNVLWKKRRNISCVHRVDGYLT